jgi:hypothetical protein
VPLQCRGPEKMLYSVQAVSLPVAGVFA